MTDRGTWGRAAPPVLLVAGTALGTAGRRGPPALQDAALAVTALVVAAMVVLAIRWLVHRRRASLASPGGRAPEPPAYGSVQWSAQRRPWALVAALFYGTHLGLFASPLASWLPSALVLGALLVGLVGAWLLRSSRRRRWAAARAAHPDRAVALVSVDDVARMRLRQWAKTVGVTVASVGRGDAVLAADDAGVTLWGPDHPGEPVHRWSWDDVELSRTSSPRDHPHLVLTLTGPPPAARARAAAATRRRFDLTLTVRSLGVGSPEAVEAAAAAALDELSARRGTPADPGEERAEAAPDATAEVR